MCVYVCVCGKGLLTRVALVTRLQPEGNMIKDRIYSMVRRNMLEHRERTKRYVMGAVCVCVCFACVCVCVRARACVCLCPSPPRNPFLRVHADSACLTPLCWNRSRDYKTKKYQNRAHKNFEHRYVLVVVVVQGNSCDLNTS